MGAIDVTEREDITLGSVERADPRRLASSSARGMDDVDEWVRDIPTVSSSAGKNDMILLED
jgi:hypothetical protein